MLARRIGRGAEFRREAERGVGEQAQHGDRVDRRADCRRPRVIERAAAGFGDQVEWRAGLFGRRRHIRHIARSDQDRRAVFNSRHAATYSRVSARGPWTRPGADPAARATKVAKRSRCTLRSRDAGACCARSRRRRVADRRRRSSVGLRGPSSAPASDCWRPGRWREGAAGKRYKHSIPSVPWQDNRHRSGAPSQRLVARVVHLTRAAWRRSYNPFAEWGYWSSTQQCSGCKQEERERRGPKSPRSRTCSWVNFRCLIIAEEDVGRTC